MASTNVTIPSSKLGSMVTMNVTVTGLRIWKARIWIALRLLSLAARIAQFKISFEIVHNGDKVEAMRVEAKK